MEWTEEKMHFSGFVKPHTVTDLHGSLLWCGTATFASGRKEEVFYRQPVVVSEGWSRSQIDSEIDHCFGKAMEMIRLGLIGYLYNWKSGRKVRPVASIEWHHWSEIHG